MGDPEARLAREQGKARNEEINGELKRALEEMVIWRKNSISHQRPCIGSCLCFQRICMTH